MKNHPLIVIFLLSTFFVTAQQSSNSFKIRGGLNSTDMNYGTEFLSDFLPKDDYSSFSAGGNGSQGYYLGVGYNRILNDHFELFSNLDYASHHYEIDGNVAELRPTVSRPLNPELPTSAKGDVIYSFFNLDFGVNYYFRQKTASGLFLSALISGNFYVDSKWKVDVLYEDGSTGTSKELPGEERDYNKLITSVGLGVGYNVPLGNQFSIAPLIDIRLGFESLVGDEPTPSTVNLGLEARYKF